MLKGKYKVLYEFLKNPTLCSYIINAFETDHIWINIYSTFIKLILNMFVLVLDCFKQLLCIIFACVDYENVIVENLLQLMLYEQSRIYAISNVLFSLVLCQCKCLLENRINEISLVQYNIYTNTVWLLNVFTKTYIHIHSKRNFLLTKIKLIQQA